MKIGSSAVVTTMAATKSTMAKSQWSKGVGITWLSHQ